MIHSTAVRICTQSLMRRPSILEPCNRSLPSKPSIIQLLAGGDGGMVAAGVAAGGSSRGSSRGSSKAVERGWSNSIQER